MTGPLEVVQVVRIGGRAASRSPLIALAAIVAVAVVVVRFAEVILIILSTFMGFVVVLVALWIWSRRSTGHSGTPAGTPGTLTIHVRPVTSADGPEPCGRCLPLVRIASYVIEVQGRVTEHRCFEHLADPTFDPIGGGRARKEVMQRHTAR